MTPLQSEITALVAGDWVLVPREPTEAMLDAGDSDMFDIDGPANVYAAMLAAAPSPDDTATRIVERIAREIEDWGEGCIDWRRFEQCAEAVRALAKKPTP